MNKKILEDVKQELLDRLKEEFRTNVCYQYDTGARELIKLMESLSPFNYDDLIKVLKQNTNTLDTNIKEWYVATYPSDELGKKLYSNNTFRDLLSALKTSKDIYLFLGEDSDTVIRERCFHELSDIQGRDYDDFYNIWLNNGKEY